MKITRAQLKQIIQEELSKVLNETTLYRYQGERKKPEGPAPEYSEIYPGGRWPNTSWRVPAKVYDPTPTGGPGTPGRWVSTDDIPERHRRELGRGPTTLSDVDPFGGDQWDTITGQARGGDPWARRAIGRPVEETGYYDTTYRSPFPIWRPEGADLLDDHLPYAGADQSRATVRRMRELPAMLDKYNASEAQEDAEDLGYVVGDDVDRNVDRFLNQQILRGED